MSILEHSVQTITDICELKNGQSVYVGFSNGHVAEGQVFIDGAGFVCQSIRIQGSNGKNLYHGSPDEFNEQVNSGNLAIFIRDEKAISIIQQRVALNFYAKIFRDLRKGDENKG